MKIIVHNLYKKKNKYIYLKFYTVYVKPIYLINYYLYIINYIKYRIEPNLT